MRGFPLALALAGSLALTGCGTLSRLSEVGRPPVLSPTANPTEDPSWRPVTMPMPRAELAPIQVNSLWRSGSRAFFKDQRAAQVGDILTVLVNIADTAKLANATGTTRTGTEAAGLPNLLGLEKKMAAAGMDPKNLLSTNSTNANTGTGTVVRAENVTVRLAAVVTQVLPNGNLVVAARQEVRVNSELRELQVTGVVRPQDIASDNTVLHDRMAEARIAYGGRGTLTDLQTPRYGQQIMDILLPF
jgi:flagellar L-ring protein precursor FlgH